jgi:hypothetical protein
MNMLNSSAKVVVMLDKPSDRRSFDLFHWLKKEHPEWNFSLKANRLSWIERILYPSALRFNTDAFQDIKQTAEAHPNIQFVYLPFFEDKSIEIAAEKENWPANLLGLLPDQQVLEVAADKEAFAQEFKGRELVVDLYTEAELEKDFPSSGIVLKPRKGRGAIGVKYITDAKAFMPEEGSTYQKRLNGKDNVIGAFYLFKEGKKIAHYQHQRVRSYPASGGVSVHAKLVHKDEIEKKGTEILSSMHWNGIAMLEFLPDFETGSYRAIECNPRVWGTVLLGEFAGARIIENYILTSLGQPLVQSNWNENAAIIWLLPYQLLFMIFQPLRWWKSRSKNAQVCWLNATRTGTLRALLFFMYALMNPEKWKILFQKIKTAK